MKNRVIETIYLTAPDISYSTAPEISLTTLRFHLLREESKCNSLNYVGL